MNSACFRCTRGVAIEVFFRTRDMSIHLPPHLHCGLYGADDVLNLRLMSSRVLGLVGRILAFLDESQVLLRKFHCLSNCGIYRLIVYALIVVG